MTAVKMNEDIRTRWVEALRSGQYEQVSHALCQILDDDEPDKVGYCCLGVLSQLALEDGVLEERAMGSLGDIEYRWDNGNRRQSGYLPSPVIAWAGIDNQFSMDPVVGKDTSGTRISLSNLNDGGRSFAEIADIIEGKVNVDS